MSPEAQVQSLRVEVLPGDRFLLCSDGVWNVLDKAAITRALASEDESMDVVKALIAASARASDRDATAVVLRCPPAG
jgi:protein phosphatase